MAEETTTTEEAPSFADQALAFMEGKMGADAPPATAEPQPTEPVPEQVKSPETTPQTVQPEKTDAPKKIPADDFKKLKELKDAEANRAKQFEAQLLDLKSKVTEYETKIKDTSAIDELNQKYQSELEDLRFQVGQANTRNLPELKGPLDKAKADAVAKVENVLDAQQRVKVKSLINHGSADERFEFLQTLAEATPAVQARVMNAFDTANAAEAAYEVALAAKESEIKTTAAERERQSEAQKLAAEKGLQELYQTKLEQATGVKFAESFDDEHGLIAFSDGVADQIRQKATAYYRRSMFEPTTDSERADMARYAGQGFVMRDLMTGFLKTIAEQQASLEEKDGKIKELEGASPRTPSMDGDVETAMPQGFAEQVAQNLRGQGVW